MSDYSESKKFGTKVYPVEANETSDLLRRTEPVLTVDLLLSRYLKSQEKDLRAGEGARGMCKRKVLMDEWHVSLFVDDHPGQPGVASLYHRQRKYVRSDLRSRVKAMLKLLGLSAMKVAITQ